MRSTTRRTPSPPSWRGCSLVTSTTSTTWNVTTRQPEPAHCSWRSATLSAKRRLRAEEIDQIVETFTKQEAVEDFSVVVSYDDIKEKNYSLAAGQYFDVKIDYVDLTPEEFQAQMAEYQATLQDLFTKSAKLQDEIMSQLNGVKFE